MLPGSCLTKLHGDSNYTRWGLTWGTFQAAEPLRWLGPQETPHSFPFTCPWDNTGTAILAYRARTLFLDTQPNTMNYDHGTCNFLLTISNTSYLYFQLPCSDIYSSTFVAFPPPSCCMYKGQNVMHSLEFSKHLQLFMLCEALNRRLFGIEMPFSTNFIKSKPFYVFEKTQIRQLTSAFVYIFFELGKVVYVTLRPWEGFKLGWKCGEVYENISEQGTELSRNILNYGVCKTFKKFENYCAQKSTLSLKACKLT